LRAGRESFTWCIDAQVIEAQVLRGFSPIA